MGLFVIGPSLYCWYIKILPNILSKVNILFPIATKYPSLTAITIDQMLFAHYICSSYLFWGNYLIVF